MRYLQRITHMNTKIGLATLAVAVCVGLFGCVQQTHVVRDYDGNPPGPRGGPGTNWENPPGPRGGPGASPDATWRHTYVGGRAWVWHPQRRCWYHDNDNNPPGRRGGVGTNWENPPGPIGGPGASPDRRACEAGRDRDDNPPGPRGGHGTNWENPPGPRGGPGASPDRR